MKRIYLLATALAALVSCTSDDFMGDSPGTKTVETVEEAINFGLTMQNSTRGADTYGASAADLLGNNFYVIGTKADNTLSPAIPTNSPTTQVVFNNYLVHYGANTAGTTTSNTANWEYVGVVPGSEPTANYVKLSPAAVTAQTIKYWDYSVPQYDFHAFSTGSKKAVSGTSGAADEIGVTASLYGAGLASNATAYTFDIPNVECLSNVYITDITPISKTNYGKDVTLKFKNLGAKVRIALYETVPGYSVEAGSIKFYTVDGTPIDPSNAEYVAPTTTGALISASSNGLPKKGTIKVSFPNVGTSNSSNANYNKASVDVTADVSNAIYKELYKTFGTISDTEKMATAEISETAGKLYLGRTLPAATYVGDKNADYYQLAFPVDDSSPLTLRVDYTLISTDGSNEKINVYGAKAVVPSTYTVWQPNYAYTYIFKISDKTNGKTAVDTDAEGLFPITFDAVVAEFTEVSGEQTTITTVATPSITTYQQNHDKTKDEYSKATAKNIYVQVMKANDTLADDLDENTTDGTNRSLLFAVAAGTTEAVVMDALEKRTTENVAEENVTGRNGISLTKSDKIANDVTSIVNGVDDNPVTVSEGTTAEIDITLAAGTYAYVYDYTTGEKTVITEFQPVAVTTSPATPIDGTDKEYYTLTTDALATTPAVVLEAAETVSSDYVYFSKTTTDGGVHYTYSYISVTGKTTVPKGTVKYPKASITTHVAGTTNAAANTFYFDRYFSNNGKYAVKVIKVQ